MGEIDFDYLGVDVMDSAFEDAWRIENAEVDGSRTYSVNATRMVFEAAGVVWQDVARSSTRGYERATGQIVNQ